MSLTDRYAEALTFAHDAHRGHVRKGTSIPYVSHLLAVSGLVLEHGGDEDQAIAGLLHGCVEDVGVHLCEPIRERFGAGVLSHPGRLTTRLRNSFGCERFQGQKQDTRLG